MGAWGGGLYDSDYAADLKQTIQGFWRVPMSDAELIDELHRSFGADASGLEAADYWLVLADQFERRGFHARPVTERAIEIIETGEDLLALEALEPEPGTGERRRKETEKLLARLRDPRPLKPRRPIRKAQPLLLEPGSAVTWPTDRGESINPYVPEEKLWALGGFAQDGWGFGVVTEAGHQFDVLAYYAIQVLLWRRPERPAPEFAQHCRRSECVYGTFKPLHKQRTRLERIGRVEIEALGPLPDSQAAQRAARQAVLEDRSITSAFGLDAFNLYHWGIKFPHPAPSGTPIDPEAPDQRPNGSGSFS